MNLKKKNAFISVKKYYSPKRNYDRAWLFHWGYYSLWFAFEIKNAKNYLIEPDPQRLAIGKKNFELNQKSAVFLNGSCWQNKVPEPNTIGAPYISIDDYMDKENIYSSPLFFVQTFRGSKQRC